MSVQYVEASSEDEGQRLDNFLMRHLRKAPKSLIYRIIRKGEVRINKGRVKPDTRIKAGDIVRIPPVTVPEKLEVTPSDSLLEVLEASILFEDNDIIAFNKPSGLAVHGGSGIQMGLIEAARALRPLAKRMELVHRLDRDTSGCILLAKKAQVLKLLHEQIREDEMSKEYLCLVKGHWPEGKCKVDVPLLKNTLQSGERMVQVSKDGKPSISYFTVQETFADCDLVAVKLKTGRTHQIRVHALSQGCPLVGDDKYGDKDFNKAFKSTGLKRLALHAQFLGFKHPVTEQWIRLEAPLFEDFKQALQVLRKG
ncbi:23S rRNA pseudouridine(955/2504/2580) synthase RluC [Thiosulfativibrio zosterae]|uniref:Pseudouridine synthase n=1 Tax=Thiosulfativibrio zosterae TaxID=2675053 RepID=A0A6F8PNX7_9GAMM|nr:23S rRNA pseudouridine(955/2504/2580) synthase RluC [Thiosulfativibrio zosterae]BBP43819.1 pseudouridine synthase [Thiosulfativibrio zosterae]